MIDKTDIESALVDALEVELDNYQNAPASWSAVNMAIDGLRARDARIEQLETALAEACSIASEFVPIDQHPRIVELRRIGELAGEALRKA